MKVVYGTAIVVVVFLLYTAVSKTPPPDSLTLFGIVYELGEHSGETASYIPATATALPTQPRLTLMQFETERNINANTALEKKLTTVGATRVGEGRFWQRTPGAIGASPTLTHISFKCVGNSVTMLKFTENLGTSELLYSPEMFRSLELIVEDIPKPSRRFQTWF